MKDKRYLQKYKNEKGFIQIGLTYFNLDGSHISIVYKSLKPWVFFSIELAPFPFSFAEYYAVRKEKITPLSCGGEAFAELPS